MSASPFRIVRPAPVLLSAFGGPKRLPVRPPALRGDGFDAAFDDDTLFFDVFRAPGSGEVLAQGPALFNLRRPSRRRACARSLRRDVRVRSSESDRHLRVVVSAPTEACALRFEGPLGAFEAEI